MTKSRPPIFAAVATALSAWAWSLPLQDAAFLEGGATDRPSVELPPGLSPTAIKAARQTLILDEPGDGRVWARGSSWKASVGHDGLTYIPFLGSDAPRNYPVQFELATVTSSGELMEFDGNPTPALDGSQVTLDRGALSEVYHVKYESIEQTFVFESLPGRGELCVALDVKTELHGRLSGSGYDFSSERGSVRYGAATAIDALGKSVAMEQRWSGSGVELIVPASFLAGATLPLTVDPIITTFGVEDDSTNQVNLDISFDAQNDVYLIVFEEQFSFTDKDIFSVFFSRGLDLVNGLASVDVTSSTWSDPQVANCFQQETFLCVATVGNAFGSRNIWGRTRDGQSGARGSQFVINDDFGDDLHADVGGFGNDTNSSFSFCVVWQRSNAPLTDSSIVSQGVTSFGTLVGSLETIADISGQLDLAPRISQSSGPTTLVSSQHQYMVVWEREESPTNRDIWARVIDFNNDVTGHDRYRAYSFSDARNPSVTMQNTEPVLSPDPHYVVAFERLVGSDYDIFAIVAEDGSANAARSLTAMQDVDINDEQSEPRIVFEGADYVVTYRGEHATGGWNLYSTALNVTSDGSQLRTGLSERKNVVSVEDGTVGASAITSDFFGASVTGTETVAVWTSEGTSGTDGDIHGAVIVEVASIVVGSQYCEANNNQTGTSGWLRATAVSRTAGVLGVGVRAISLPPNQFCLFIAGQGTDVTPNVGGSAGDLCISGGLGRYNGQVVNSGPAGEAELVMRPDNVPTPSGSTAFAPGDTWNFQCWSRDVANGVATSNFTNAIAVTLL